MIVQTAASNTLIQAMVPDALRGRVMAVYSMMFMGMAPFGALLAGVLAGRLGAPATVAAGGRGLHRRGRSRSRPGCRPCGSRAGNCC